MTREVGLWIDHKQAVIVILLRQGEQLEHISSTMSKNTQHSDASSSTGASGFHHDAAEDAHERRPGNQFNDYYDIVVSNLRGADSILIIGPGDAKDMLQKRLEALSLGGRIVGVETADKMSDTQITAAVREHFRR